MRPTLWPWSYDVENGDGRVPDDGVGDGAEFDVEEPRGGGEDAGLDLRVGEVGADGLGVEVVGGAAELLDPVAGVWRRDGLAGRVAASGRRP